MPRKSQYRGEEKLAIRNEFDQGTSHKLMETLQVSCKVVMCEDSLQPHISNFIPMSFSLKVHSR
jgi:hypothetical protein